ncbi:MAG: hypothetical protein ACHQTE_00940 [Candidatus Saccharimonadales bacterium]
MAQALNGHNEFNSPVDTPTERADVRRENQHKHLYPVVGGAALLLTAGVLLAPSIRDTINHSVDVMNHPVAYSSETQTYVARPNDGLYNAAYSVDGIEKVNLNDVVKHIHDDPANADVLRDGLQVGEVLVVPEHVDPR